MKHYELWKINDYNAFEQRYEKSIIKLMKYALETIGSDDAVQDLAYLHETYPAYMEQYDNNAESNYQSYKQQIVD